MNGGFSKPSFVNYYSTMKLVTQVGVNWKYILKLVCSSLVSYSEFIVSTHLCPIVTLEDLLDFINAHLCPIETD